VAVIQPDCLVQNAPLMKQFRQLWADSPKNAELAAWVVKITAPTTGYLLSRWRGGGPDSAGVSLASMPTAAVAIVHTHPVDLTSKYQGAEKPSTRGGNGRGDWGAAIQVGKPVYVLSADAIWMVMPNPDYCVQFQVAGPKWQGP
jgi:hypothetical protein